MQIQDSNPVGILTDLTVINRADQILAEDGIRSTEEIRSVKLENVLVSLCGREGTSECLELPGGRDGLLGVIPLEALGLELDLKNQKLKILPTRTADTYLTIL